MFEGIFQPLHLIVILGIVLLLFGPSKLAGLGKGLGDAINGFRKSMRDGGDQSNITTTTDAQQEKTVRS